MGEPAPTMGTVYGIEIVNDVVIRIRTLRAAIDADSSIEIHGISEQ